MANGVGRVILPPAGEVWPHEIATARVLASELCCDVEFATRIEGQRVKTADISMRGALWEMKAPTSGSTKSLQKVLRRAGGQSHNVVVDTIRMKGVSDSDAERELRRLKPLVRSVHRLLFLGKARKVVEIP